MDIFLVIFFALLWALTLVLSYGQGWLKGYDVAADNHKWNRWLLRKYENRSVRF